MFCSTARFRFRETMPQTQLTWDWQSVFKISPPGGKVLLVDPWLTNPFFEKGKEELAALKQVDLIFAFFENGIGQPGIDQKDLAARGDDFEPRLPIPGELCLRHGFTKPKTRG